MRAEWSLVVLALGLHFVQALVQPDLNHNILKEHLTCVATVHATTIQRDNRRPHMAWCNFMNPGTSGSCPFGPTISVNSNHIAQRGWNENVWLENKQQPPPPFDNALWRIPQVQYYIQRHDEKSWPALLRNTELMVRLQITDWIYECIKKQNKIKSPLGLFAARCIQETEWVKYSTGIFCNSSLESCITRITSAKLRASWETIKFSRVDAHRPSLCGHRVRARPRRPLKARPRVKLMR